MKTQRFDDDYLDDANRGNFFSSFPFSFSLGFTLAEVLITLTVIGVLAAMTIPALVAGYEKQALKTQFKKTYSILNQAISMVIQDNGGAPYACYIQDYWAAEYYSECPQFFNALKEKLNVIDTKYSIPGEGYIPDYTGIDLIEAQGGSNINWSCSGMVTSGKGYKQSWTLKDGTILFSYTNSFDGISLLGIDINGLKKPNKWGYDLFVINLSKRNNSSAIIIDDNLCGSKEKGGHFVHEILNE